VDDRGEIQTLFIFTPCGNKRFTARRAVKKLKKTKQAN
jgi:hypothetical protein